MAKTTFTVNEKPNRPDLNVADNFLMETAENKTLKAALGSIYSFIKSLLVSESQLFDHTNIKNIGTKTHTQIDAFINSATTNFASAAQGQKADTAVQPVDLIPKLNVGLDKVDNTADIDKPISTLTQTALDKKESMIFANTSIYVDNTRSDSYTERGTLGSPYKSISAALEYVSSDIKYSKYVIILSPSIYVLDNALTFPNKEIIFEGYGSEIVGSVNILDSNIIINNCSITGTLVVSGADHLHTFSNLKVNGPVSINGRTTIDNSTITGSVTINSILEAYKLTASLESSTDYVINASSGSKIKLFNSSVTNTIGNCINCDNGAHSSFNEYNIIVGCNIKALPAGVAINSGVSAVELLQNNVVGSIVGSNLIAFEADVIASSYVNIGSDAAGDMYYRSAGGKLTRLGIGSSGKIISSDGSAPVWIEKPVDIPGNAATSTLADAAKKLSTSRKISGVDFDGTSDITITPALAQAASKLETARTINGIPFDGTQNIVIEAEDPYNSNNLLELDMTNGDVIIDGTNCQYAGYILTGSPSVQVSLIITSPNKYYKIINRITTSVPILIESGL